MSDDNSGQGQRCPPWKLISLLRGRSGIDMHRRQPPGSLVARSEAADLSAHQGRTSPFFGSFRSYATETFARYGSRNNGKINGRAADVNLGAGHMRRAFAIVLVGVAVFAFVLTILLPTVVVDRSKKTPLDLDITQISSGPATLYDANTGQTNQVQLRATRTVRTDTSASDNTNTTMVETLCIVIVDNPAMPNCVPASDKRLLSVTTDRVTSDRKTAEAVHVAKYREQINGVSTINGELVRHTGLSYKWPIDAKKQTYQFFQPDLNRAFPAVYAGKSTIKGLTVYKYVSATGVQPYRIRDLLDGTYDDTRTVWVEPQTGTILNGVEHQVQKLGDGTVALDTTLSFNPSAVTDQANFAKSKLDKLKMAQLWGPLVTGIVAVLAAIGAFLLFRRRRTDGAHSEGRDKPSSGSDAKRGDPRSITLPEQQQSGDQPIWR
jgi:hypothetical protein